MLQVQNRTDLNHRAVVLQTDVLDLSQYGIFSRFISQLC